MHILRVHRVFFAKSLDLGLISTDKSPRTRAKIIAELASLPSAIQEKICEDKKRLANGATAVYHNLQYWANGRNHTVRIPKNKLPAFREGCEADDKAKVVCVRADGTGMPMRKECLLRAKLPPPPSPPLGASNKTACPFRPDIRIGDRPQ